MSPLRWTTKSTRWLADELTRQGHRVSADTVADLLREEGFSLQGKVTDSRQARYCGLAKTTLDHNIKAAALNLIRLDAWWNGEVLDPRHTSHLTRLQLALSV